MLCQHYSHDNQFDILKLFFFTSDGDIDVAAKVSFGWTALHQLSRFYINVNLIELVNLLVENGVDVAAKEYIRGWTELHFLRRNYEHDYLIDV